MATIQVDIQKSFKNLTLSFQFSADNNRVVLFGPSGSGKSVLLKMIAGFFDPDDGEIRISDRIFFDRNKQLNIPTYHRNIGFLPQEYTLFPNMTVEENITYGLRTQKLPIDQSAFKRLIERFDLGNKLSSHPKDLSGGQLQRAALARILLIRPDLLLLDEPFSALDSSIRESLRDLVIEIADEMEINVLFVTHDMEEAFVFCKEAIIILDGEVLEFGARDQIFDRPKYVETARLVGFENIWLLNKLEQGKAFTNQGMAFSFKGPAEPTARNLCIRPENVMILREDQPYKNALKENMITGLISNIHDRGRYIKVLVEGDNGFNISVNIPTHAFSRLALDKGKRIKVSLKEESIVLCETRYPEQ
jgi:molybdate transport system ATP-binding protein